MASTLAHEMAQPLTAASNYIAMVEMALRGTGACTKLAEPLDFAALFALWHGRAPADDDWSSF